MKIRQINLDSHELPMSAVVKMSKDEMIYIVKLLGRMTGNQANEVMAGGDALSNDIYLTLTSSVFNTFWEDGVDGALRER